MKLKALVFAMAAILLGTLSAQAAATMCCDQPACCQGGSCCGK